MVTHKLFDSITITASNAEESTSVKLHPYAANGFFSLQIGLTGNGTAKFEYEISNDDETYITQIATADQIVSGFIKTSGPGSDGKDIISFEPEPAEKMKIKCTETGGVDSVTITATLLML